VVVDVERASVDDPYCEKGNSSSSPVGRARLENVVPADEEDEDEEEDEEDDDEEEAVARGSMRGVRKMAD
jgi:hypothetical protein